MNTHLESTAKHTVERMNQLRTCFTRIHDSDEVKNVIMGGDLNLRDKEVGPRLLFKTKWYSLEQSSDFACCRCLKLEDSRLVSRICG